MQNWQKLSSCSREDITRIQNSSLRNAVKYLWPFQPYFRSLSNKTDSFLVINKIDDLERLPFTDKSFFLSQTEGKSSGYLQFILQPNKQLIKKLWPLNKKLALIIKKAAGIDAEKQIKDEFNPIHLHFTTGRSAVQIPILYTKNDLETLGKTGERIFEIIGAQDDEVVVSAFPYAPHLAFWLGYYASKQVGLLSLHTGGGKILGTQKVIDALGTLKASMFLATPGYGYHVLRKAAAQQKSYKNLKFIIFGGERVSPELRAKIKELLTSLGAGKAKVLSTYAFTEGKTAWVQCHEGSGYHLYPDLEYIELVDELGNKVEEGKPGEIVYTGLDWRGSTVIRYRTGDMSKGLYFSKPCEFCGRNLPRLHPDIERKSENVGLNLTKIKGELVNVNSFFSVIHRVSEIVEWQVEISKKNHDPFELDELIIHIAIKKDASFSEVEKKLCSEIKEEMFLVPRVDVHPLSELVEMLGLETELKEKRIIDTRKSIEGKNVPSD